MSGANGKQTGDSAGEGSTLWFRIAGFVFVVRVLIDVESRPVPAWRASR
jgi:hypothetical protein